MVYLMYGSSRKNRERGRGRTPISSSAHTLHMYTCLRQHLRGAARHAAHLWDQRPPKSLKLRDTSKVPCPLLGHASMEEIGDLNHRWGKVVAASLELLTGHAPREDMILMNTKDHTAQLGCVWRRLEPFMAWRCDFAGSQVIAQHGQSGMQPV